MNRDAIVDSIVAARGVQVQRKDKDLMDDTGGTSKQRGREPSQRPPRDDVRHRDRPKDKPAPNRDVDTDKDPDKTQDKDIRMAAYPFMPFFPIPTYADKVTSALVNILAEIKQVSEKSFAAYDDIMAEAKSLVENNIDLVKQFEEGCNRPQLCAEVLYGVMVSSEGCENNLINQPISREASNAGMAKGILSKFPQTLKALVQRAG
jgi:hypothetical protein